MIRDSAKLLVMFLIAFVIFVTMSYGISTTTTQISTLSADPGINVSTSVTPIMTTIVTLFQMIWGVITLGLGLAFVLSLLIGRSQYNQYYGGDSYEY